MSHNVTPVACTVTNAQKNRLILLGLMTESGWDFYDKEWWHYQLFNAADYPLLSDKDAPKSMMS